MRGSTRTFHWCGAVIVSSSHLLTAAHCLEDYPKESYVVRVGDWDQDVEDIDEQEFSIAAVHFHPEYNVGAYLNNDLAVVRLKTPVRLSSRVSPACLPSSTTSYSPGRLIHSESGLNNVLLRQLSYGIKSQLKAPKASY